MERDPATLQRVYTADTTKPQPLRFFCRGERYEFWGLIEGRFHFVCPPEGGTFFLLGTDRLGRDMFSRIVYAARISLTIGIIGIALSFVLALVLGGLAGYYGGWIDSVVQRITEIIKSFPHLPLWLALSAALPVTWSPLLIYFGITIILALLDWPGLGRAVRSKLLSLREEDYAAAAQMMGAKPARIIGRHLLPGFMSHLIASATLSIPSMILAETALSFLGPRPAAADHLLGRAAERGDGHQCRGGELVADAAGRAGDPGDPGLSVHGRRHAGRGGSLRLSAQRLSVGGRQGL